MNNKQLAMAVLNYKQYDRLPIVHFVFWMETLEKWHHEGHLTFEQAHNWADGTPIDKQIGIKISLSVRKSINSIL